MKMTPDERLKMLLNDGERLVRAPCGLGSEIRAGDWLAISGKKPAAGDIVALFVKEDVPFNMARVLEENGHFLLLHNAQNQVEEWPKGRNIAVVAMAAHRF